MYWLSRSMSYLPATVFDSFHDSINSSISEFIEYLSLFFLFTWLMAGFIGLFRVLKWNNPIEAYLLRIFYYLNSIARESRVQFESMIQTFFFFIFYWSMLIATFDDDQEELIEIFDTAFFTFFCALVVFLIFKYSQHYFAFFRSLGCWRSNCYIRGKTVFQRYY